MGMTAPVKMRCTRCGELIPQGAPIERLKGDTVKYGHIGCGPGRPPGAKPGDSKAGPKIDAPTPKGWVTEDKFALPEDAIKRLRGQDSPSEIEVAAGAKHGDKIDQQKDDGKGDDDGGNGDDKGQEPGSEDGEGIPDIFEDKDGDGGTEEGEDADGSGDEVEGDKDGDKDDGDSESEQDSDQSGDKDDGKEKKPKPKPKTGKLEDLPDDLLLRLAMLAADMAAQKVKGAIEPRLAKLLAESVEPLTARLAGDFQRKLGESVRDQVHGAVEETRRDAGKMVDALRKEIDRRVADEVKRLESLKVVTHKIERADGTEKVFPDTELFHFAFDEVLKLAAAGFDVFTPGPTGCGKTHMFGQIAAALDLEFGLISGTGGVTESELFGTSYPNITNGQNVYQETDFVRLYENGGLFLLDEADAMDANCFLKVNAAIANGFCTVPKRYGNTRAKRHPKFIFALAANTWGHGATRLYCGRNRLDEATLDRFRGGTVPMDYDPAIERRLVPDRELFQMLTDWRGKITAHGIPRVLSTRFMTHAVRLKAMGYDRTGIAKKLCGGWTPGEVEKVVGKLAA